MEFKESVEQGVAEGEGGLGQTAGIGINGKQFNFSIKDLIAKAKDYPVKKLDPQLFVKQLADRHEDPKQTASRAQSADLQYPIIVVQDGNTLMIADGTHRAQKAIMNKLPSINAHVIPVKDMAEFSKQGVAEGGVGVVKGGSDPRYSTATMGDQNAVTGKTLGKKMRDLHLAEVDDFDAEVDDFDTTAAKMKKNLLNMVDMHINSIQQMIKGDPEAAQAFAPKLKELEQKKLEIIIGRKLGAN
jgi:hypothetical protein